MKTTKRVRLTKKNTKQQKKGNNKKSVRKIKKGGFLGLFDDDSYDPYKQINRDTTLAIQRVDSKINSLKTKYETQKQRFDIERSKLENIQSRINAFTKQRSQLAEIKAKITSN